MKHEGENCHGPISLKCIRSAGRNGGCALPGAAAAGMSARRRVEPGPGAMAGERDISCHGTALMTRFHRHAIYWAPPAGSDLARFGTSWLGWDADAGEAPLASAALRGAASITAEPRRYGFHATLKPPFRLAAGKEADALDQAAAELAASIAPFTAPPLRPARMGDRIALLPSQASQALDQLAARVVTELDLFRAPPGAAELDKRRAVGLSVRQEAMLTRWGYPFVLDEFRFHLTLTGKLDPKTLNDTLDELRELTAPFDTSPCQSPRSAFSARMRRGSSTFSGAIPWPAERAGGGPVALGCAQNHPRHLK